jgi:acetylornithine/succinyldiaminopimelate/putrescine aminotransferase
VARALRRQRILLNATGPSTLRLLPPLVAGQAELDDAVERLSAALSS